MATHVLPPNPPGLSYVFMSVGTDQVDTFTPANNAYLDPGVTLGDTNGAFLQFTANKNAGRHYILYPFTPPPDFPSSSLSDNDLLAAVSEVRVRALTYIWDNLDPLGDDSLIARFPGLDNGTGAQFGYVNGSFVSNVGDGSIIRAFPNDWPMGSSRGTVMQAGSGTFTPTTAAHASVLRQIIDNGAIHVAFGGNHNANMGAEGPFTCYVARLTIEIDYTPPVVIPSGTGTGSVTVSGSASGSIDYSGSASGSVTASGAAAGSISASGSASGSVTVSGSASGSQPAPIPTGSATGEVAAVGGGTMYRFDESHTWPEAGDFEWFSGDAYFNRTDVAGVTRTIAWFQQLIGRDIRLVYPVEGGTYRVDNVLDPGNNNVQILTTPNDSNTGWVNQTLVPFAFDDAHGSAPALSPSSGSATGSVAVTGSAAGSATLSGTATGSVTVSGSASGSRTSEGTVSGSVTVSGSASGTAPTVGENSGSAGGTVLISGTAIGSRESVGAVSGSVSVAGAASGTSPTVGVNNGSASGAVAVSGSASGSRSVLGSVSGSVVASGSATGSRTSSGSASGSVTISGLAVGVTSARGTASGSVVVSGLAAGSLAAVGSVIAAVVVSGVASGTAGLSQVKAWNGAEWVTPQIWDGQAWVPLKVWNGSVWVG